jgi:hypothetical protein
MNQSRWLNLRRQWGAAHFTSVAFSADLSACLRTGTSCIFDYNAQSSLFAMDGSGSLKSRRVRALPTKSHLSRWVRRVHGVSLKEIARPLIRDQNSKNLHDLSLAPP